MEPTFTFPFKPYAIQQQFMKELYLTLENGKVGIFESPTGTGKSLSICCGALQWLQDFNNKNLEQLEKEIALLKLETTNECETDDWLQEEYEKIKKNQQLCNLQTKLDKIRKYKENIESMRIRVEKLKLSNKSQDVYFSDKYKQRDDKENVSKGENIESETVDDVDLLLEEANDCDDDENYVIEEVEEKDDITKIYISSRTHSQLSQFVGEIKRTIFKDMMSVVTLASRAHYCINSDVSKLKNIQLINERCLDLQKSKSKSTSVGNDGTVVKKSKIKCTSCPYYNQSNINKLKERLLVELMDMEDIVKSGKALKACPYYASRMALDEAQVVLLSHAGIVSSGARTGTQLKLNNNILILDEAHGLSSALEQANSAPITHRQLLSLKTYFKFYINKYMTKFNSKNLLSLNQMVFVVGRLLTIIQNTKNEEQTSIYTLEDFVIKAEIDHMNLRPLVEFCRNTKLAPKLHGFFLRYNQTVLEEEKKKSVPKKTTFESFLNNISKNKVEDVKVDVADVKAPIQSETSPGSGLYALLDFLDMLCDRSENGRILCNINKDNTHLKYILLNSAQHFTDVVKQCRSVILAGGTMEPISEFEYLLFGHNDNERNDKLTLLRCEHVVPHENVLGLCLTKGPTNVKLNFTYENRMADGLLDEVCRILCTVCKIVHGGVIVFVPSYNQEIALYDKLEHSGVLNNITNYKHVFREPKSAGQVDQVLNDYSSSIRNKKSEGKNGALLLSVVGGKLSEGLNFSDDLGRCVIVIGMPYPNIKSPELQQKMNYLTRTSGSAASAAYYEGLCMKAVNQCIGRAIRHANDYACVLLIDERYSRQQTLSALPGFVQKSLKSDCSFGIAVGSIAKFFASHKTLNNTN